MQKLLSVIWWLRFNFANFEGRISRGQFWFALSMMAVPIVALFNLTVFRSALIGVVGQQASFAMWVILLLVAILLTVPFYAICVRRLHDVGMSGKHVLWMLPTGVLGFGALCFFFVEKGEPFANRFGPRPQG